MDKKCQQFLEEKVGRRLASYLEKWKKPRTYDHAEDSNIQI